MIKVKYNVKPKNLVIMAACANVGNELNIEVTVTSGMDGKHSPSSLHPRGDALDVRSKTLDSEFKMIFLSKVLKRLGKSYQGFLEDEGKVNEHFHFEYDPD